MVHHFRYHNTNCFFFGNLESERLIAFDAGWPCTLYEYQRRMKDIGLRFADIQIAVVYYVEDRPGEPAREGQAFPRR